MSDINILIIDDDPWICYTIEEICISQDWNGISTDSFYNAMKVLSNMKINVALVDYHMPQMNGIALVKRIRKEYNSLPIIVLTVEERESVFRGFMDAGADDYALKPIKAMDLIARINVHLRYMKNFQYYNDVSKGISKVTLTKLVSFLQGQSDYISINSIERGTGIKQKTLYRYLQYLVKEYLVEVQSVYGKIGRPKIYYKIKKSQEFK